MPANPPHPKREEQVANLLHAAAQRERAPETLRAEVATMRAQAAERRDRRRRRRWSPSFQPAFRFVSAGTTAAAALVVALVLALGGAGAPSLAQAAALANRAPTRPAPATDPRDPAKLLSAKVGTLHFPNWAANGGWRAVGQRIDHIGNRTVRTVYYANGSKRVAYSIVSSPTLPIKRGTVLQSVPAQTYTTISRQGRSTVVWQEAGHTCLLTGSHGMPASRLWHLAFYGFRKPLS